MSFHIPALLLVALMVSGCGKEPTETTSFSEDTIRSNNRGVGLMGSFDYPGALAVFEKLVQDHPEVVEFRINRAISTLNRQLDGDEESAMAQFEEVLARQPENLNALYMAGLLNLRKGDKAATALLRKVLDKDPEDTYAAYFLAQSLEQHGQKQEAMKLYERIMRQDPYLRSAWYAGFLIERRDGDREKAKAYLDSYQQLATNPRAQLAEFKYTRMGRKADVVTVSNPSAALTMPGGALFGEPVKIASILTARINAHITVADINGDGLTDIFIAGASSSTGAHNSVLIATKDGTYQSDGNHPLAAIDNINAALWGDIDNDGLPDVFLCRSGINQLWKQVSIARWENITESSHLGGDPFDTSDGLLFDADHDGDLDIYTINANGPNELFNNNLDGTFRRLASERNIAGNGSGSKSVLTLDIDNDRDTDILVINNQPPHSLYINDRLWAWREGTGVDALINTDVDHAVAADLDADGHPEIYTSDSKNELIVWKANEDGIWLGHSIKASPEVSSLAILDVDGDGVPNLLIGNSEGSHVADLAADTLQIVYSANAPVINRATLAGEKGPALLSLSESALSLLPPGDGRFPFLLLSLSGLLNEADSMRSNASGIGTRIAVRQGSRWSLSDSFRHHSGPGQSHQPVAIGLGDANSADFIALNWSDGVFQTELNLEAGKLHHITETQRQLSSCPVLFAWDGTQYRFISDILGVGGIGYMVAPGEYSSPRPHENFLMPEGSLVAENGHFVIKIGEPMEEVAYIDAVRLVAYDLPPGWDMVLDERMGILGPQPTGESLYYMKELLPARAINSDGTDVTSRVLMADLTAPGVGEIDRRFIGRLKQEQQLTLEFDESITGDHGRAVLMIDGWVEYPYSQTMFAAWQANADIEAPTLDYRAADGNWRTLYEQFGYPAGMPRRMTMPLDLLPDDTRIIRLRTNQEVYWDRISIVWSQPSDEVKTHRLRLANARVDESGFAYRTTGPQRQPHYDYTNRPALWDTRHMSGYYTEFGDSTELVTHTDDAVAIIGPGEEVHIEFENTLPPLSKGWTRRFVVESNGWAKDMDLFTKNGETVGPLPTTGKPQSIRDSLHTRYNTRFRSGY